MKLHQLLNEEEYIKAQEEFGEEAFTASIGAEALRTMLSAIKLPEERERLRVELKETNSGFVVPGVAAGLSLLIMFVGSLDHVNQIALGLASLCFRNP